MNQTVEGIYKLLAFGVGIVTQSFWDVLHHLVPWSIYQTPSTQGQKGDTDSSPRVNTGISDGKLFDNLLDHILLALPIAPRRVISELFVMKGISTTARFCSASCIWVLATDVEIYASRVNIRQTTDRANNIAVLPAYYIYTQIIHTVIASVGRLPLLAMLYAVCCGFSASLTPAANRERDAAGFFNLKGDVST